MSIKLGTVDLSFGDLSGYIKTTGDQTIAGVKTFSSSPIVPTPTLGTQAVNKDYVDDNAGGGATIAYNTITTLTDNTIYQAGVNGGFLVGRRNGLSGVTHCYIYADTNPDPTTIRAYWLSGIQSQPNCTLGTPILPNHYFKTTGLITDLVFYESI